MKRTIRQVLIDDIVIIDGFDNKVLDVGERGFVTESEIYFTFEEAEEDGVKIKQPEQGIEIAEEYWMDFHASDVIENRNLIIELQREVNKLKERVK